MVRNSSGCLCAYGFTTAEVESCLFVSMLRYDHRAEVSTKSSCSCALSCRVSGMSRASGASTAVIGEFTPLPKGELI